MAKLLSSGIGACSSQTWWTTTFGSLFNFWNLASTCRGVVRTRVHGLGWDPEVSLGKTIIVPKSPVTIPQRRTDPFRLGFFNPQQHGGASCNSLGISLLEITNCGGPSVKQFQMEQHLFFLMQPSGYPNPKLSDYHLIKDCHSKIRQTSHSKIMAYRLVNLSSRVNQYRTLARYCNEVKNNVCVGANLSLL